MKHSLSREYKPDMILLFYDFNNSLTSSKSQSKPAEVISALVPAKNQKSITIKEVVEHENKSRGGDPLLSNR